MNMVYSSNTQAESDQRITIITPEIDWKSPQLYHERVYLRNWKTASSILFLAVGLVNVAFPSNRSIVSLRYHRILVRDLLKQKNRKQKENKKKRKEDSQRNEERQYEILFKTIHSVWNTKKLICLLFHLSWSPLPQKIVLLDNPVKKLHEQFAMSLRQACWAWNMPPVSGHRAGFPQHIHCPVASYIVHVLDQPQDRCVDIPLRQTRLVSVKSLSEDTFACFL